MQHNVIISLPLAEFTGLIERTVQTVLKNWNDATPPAAVAVPPDAGFITRKEAAALLRVSLPTLSALTKSRKITGYRIGHSIRYRKTELEGAPTVVCPHNTANA